MPYFSESDGKPERIGKIIGDVFSAFIIVALIAVFIQSMMVR